MIEGIKDRSSLLAKGSFTNSNGPLLSSEVNQMLYIYVSPRHGAVVSENRCERFEQITHVHTYW